MKNLLESKKNAFSGVHPCPGINRAAVVHGHGVQVTTYDMVVCQPASDKYTINIISLGFVFD